LVFSILAFFYFTNCCCVGDRSTISKTKKSAHIIFDDGGLLNRHISVASHQIVTKFIPHDSPRVTLLDYIHSSILMIPRFYRLFS
jgi:hypothetical protein